MCIRMSTTNDIVKQMAILYEQELYSDLTKMGALVISMYEQKQDIISQYAKFQLYMYYAEALFNLQEYGPAESAYSTALQIRKYILKLKGTSPKAQDEDKELISDIDIKYKIHVCYIKLKQHQKAIEILQSVSARSRTPKINTALGNLYRDTGMERPAISCYKEVLRECPSAINAAENLLKLGVKGIEVNSMILGATSECSWLNVWLRGLAEMHSREHNNAITTFQSLDMQGSLKDNTTLLVNLARCYNFIRDDKKALLLLQRVARIDPNFVTGKDLLAALLGSSSDKEHHRELERLVPDFDMSLWASEHWVVMGYHMFTNERYDKAAYFGQQACLLNKRNVEALLLKAATFVQINKFQEAALHYREVLQYCPCRFEANYGLVQCYIAMNRLREATTVANNACKQVSHLAAALTLYASVLLKDSINTGRARSMLERAIAKDPSYMPPVYLLAEQLEQEQLYDEAVALLKHHIEMNPSSRLHQILGDCLARLKKEDEAFTHYSIALRLDAQNQRALEGMNNIGRSSSSSSSSNNNKLESNYYMSVGVETPGGYTPQALAGSDQEADPDSDTDQWPHNRRDLISFD